MGYKLDSDEVAVLIKPVYNEDGDWVMELKTGITFGKDVKGEAGQAAVDAAITMAAALAFVQDNEDILDYLDEYKHEIIKHMYPDEYAEVLRENEEASGYTTDGNVIKLNAWTKTQGNA